MKNFLNKIRADIILLIIAVLDAVYLTKHHYLINILKPTTKSFCSINSIVDCDGVALSDFSMMFGIPVSSIGVFAYLFLLIIFIFLEKKYRSEKYTISFFIFLSMAIFSFYEFFASIFIIKSICLMCCLLYLSIILLLLITKVNSEKTIKEIVVNIFPALKEVLTSKKNIILIMLALLVSLATAYKTDRFFHNKFEKENIERINAKALHSLDEKKSILIEKFNNLPIAKFDLSNTEMSGSKNAKVEIVEFSDFECPACGQMTHLISQLKKDYKGKIKVFFKNYPLDQKCNKTITRPFHQYACKAAEYAYCASEQNKFWFFHDLVFKNRKSLSDNLIESIFDNQTELNSKKFNDCLNNRAKKAIKKDVDEAIKLNLSYTPTIFINGKKVSDIVDSYKDYLILVEHLSK